MVHRTDHRHAAAADPVAQREQLVETVDGKGEVLHGARRRVATCVARMGDADDRRVGVVGVLLECDVTGGAELDESVEGVGHAVHPVERFQLGAEHVGEELDLGLDVARGDGEVMDAVRVQCHAEMVRLAGCVFVTG